MSIYDNITYGLFYAIILHETRNLRNIPNFIAYADIYLHNVWSYYQDKMTLTEDTLYFDLFRKIFINNTIWWKSINKQNL